MLTAVCVSTLFSLHYHRDPSADQTNRRDIHLHKVSLHLDWCKVECIWSSSKGAFSALGCYVIRALEFVWRNHCKMSWRLQLMERRISYYPKCKIISYFHGHLAKIQQWAPAQYTAEIKIIFFHPATRKKNQREKSKSRRNTQKQTDIFWNIP